MEVLGHPVVGDYKYGSIEDSLGRLGLHAFRLAFMHPVTHEEGNGLDVKREHFVNSDRQDGNGSKSEHPLVEHEHMITAYYRRENRKINSKPQLAAENYQVATIVGSVTRLWGITHDQQASTGKT